MSAGRAGWREPSEKGWGTRGGSVRVCDRMGTGQDRIGQRENRIGEDWTGWDRMEQDGIGQDRTGQDRIG